MTGGATETVRTGSPSRLGGVKTLKVDGFLNEFEKGDLKQKVDLVDLFSHFGVKAEKKGRSYMARCPWHDDSTPSLSIDREKGLYNCFGCGESGDAFDLVKKQMGVGFKEALVFIKEYAGTDSPAKPSEQPGIELPAELEPEPVPETVPEAEPVSMLQSVTLTDVLDYYRKGLQANRRAVEYLAGRGLDDLSLLNRFSAGYCAGTLTEVVSARQKEELTLLGIFNDKGGESFKGCVVFPFHDEAGRVTGLYGRKINEKAKVKHLYLKGPHKGLFNRKALSVYRDRLIITESLIDALSLIRLGFENTTCLYGTNGFTDELKTALKDERVKEIILALDNDEAGREASAKHKEYLVSEGFTVKEVFPQDAKDWNSFLNSGGKKETIQLLIDAAPLYSQAEEAGLTFTVRREGPKYRFEINRVSYRLLGVKDMFVSSLRVNIRARRGDAQYLDNADLYSARSRNLFARSLSEVLGMETATAEKDLLRIVEHLEAERDKLLAAGEEEHRELTEEERMLGMEFLTSPDLFERIAADTETLGYVGERINKQLIYLAASSRKLDDPISVIVVSQSAAGKSYLIDTVKKLIPPEEVVSMTSLSDQALNYLPADGLINKFLVMGEAVHSEVVEHQIREMLSAHELSRLVTMKDPKTGAMMSRIVRKEVIVSAVMSSTNHNINPENASRNFVVNTDESEDQTRAIHRAQRQKYSVRRYESKETLIPGILKTHHAAQRLLVKRVIVNPFADLLEFPSQLMRSRRDHERFIDLIAAVCFLRQFQKEEKVSGSGVTFIECDLEDYQTAYEIMTQILPSTLTNFPKSALELYEAVRGIIKEKAKEEGLKTAEVSLTQREIREKTAFSQMFVKRNMRLLSDYEYVIISGAPGARSRKSYRLIADEAINLIDLSVIPTPEAMKKQVRDGSKVKNL